jgi:hypothetical protein
LFLSSKQPKKTTKPNKKRKKISFLSQRKISFSKQSSFFSLQQKQKRNLPPTIDLLGFPSTLGSSFESFVAGDQSGFSVSSAGDFNGDGISDITIGAPFADCPNPFPPPDTRSNAGIIYVIYVKDGGYASNIDLNLLTTEGFAIFGAEIDDEWFFC